MIELNVDQAWQLVLLQAQKAASAKDSWYSPKHKKSYSIKEFSQKKVVVSREGLLRDSSFGEKYLLKRIEQINNSNGILSRRSWDGHVAKMAAIIHLHPQLKWDDTFDNIICVNFYTRPIYKDYGEAPKDDPSELQLFARKVRSGQKKFRNTLLKAYSGKCCISKCDIDVTLDACHIIAHSIDGKNNTENGLLLRTDIHDLFDSGLLAISPVDLIIHIHPMLKLSEYVKYDGEKILDRVDGKIPSKDYLSEKWKSKIW